MPFNPPSRFGSRMEAAGSPQNRRPWHTSAPRGLHEDFETPEAAEEEDCTRSRLLRARESPAARLLGQQLAATGSPHMPPPSLASARFSRLHRIRIISAAVPLLLQERRWFVTVIPPAWWTPAGTLHAVNPQTLLQGFRQQIIRAGARTSQGLLVVRLEASLELQPGTENLGWQLHLHGVATTGMREALDRLGDLRAYADRMAVRQPVRCKALCSSRLARVMGYATKSFWRSGVAGQVEYQGRSLPLHPRGRLPEPFHTEALVWLHRWTPGEVSLVLGTNRLRYAMRRAWE